MALMDGTVVEAVTELWTTTCGNCGGTYAISKRFRDTCYERGLYGWRCPYCDDGIKWGYGEDETARAKRELEQARRRAASAEGRAEREAHRANGYKGAMRKVQKRVARGVCPCCNRTFKDLAAHMETKHPDYAS